MNQKFNKLFLITALLIRKFRYRPVHVVLIVFFGMQLFLLSACKKKSDFAHDSTDGSALFFYGGSDKFIASAVKKLKEQNGAQAFPIMDNESVSWERPLLRGHFGSDSSFELIFPIANADKLLTGYFQVAIGTDASATSALYQPVNDELTQNGDSSKLKQIAGICKKFALHDYQVPKNIESIKDGPVIAKTTNNLQHGPVVAKTKNNKAAGARAAATGMCEMTLDIHYEMYYNSNCINYNDLVTAINTYIAYTLPSYLTVNGKTALVSDSPDGWGLVLTGEKDLMEGYYNDLNDLYWRVEYMLRVYPNNCLLGPLYLDRIDFLSYECDETNPDPGTDPGGTDPGTDPNPGRTQAEAKAMVQDVFNNSESVDYSYTDNTAEEVFNQTEDSFFLKEAPKWDPIYIARFYTRNNEVAYTAYFKSEKSKPIIGDQWRYKSFEFDKITKTSGVVPAPFGATISANSVTINIPPDHLSAKVKIEYTYSVTVPFLNGLEVDSRTYTTGEYTYTAATNY